MGDAELQAQEIPDIRLGGPFRGKESVNIGQRPGGQSPPSGKPVSLTQCGSIEYRFHASIRFPGFQMAVSRFRQITMALYASVV
jgi:hypothetical protein